MLFDSYGNQSDAWTTLHYDGSSDLDEILLGHEMVNEKIIFENLSRLLWRSSRQDFQGVTKGTKDIRTFSQTIHIHSSKNVINKLIRWSY